MFFSNFPYILLLSFFHSPLYEWVYDYESTFRCVVCVCVGVILLHLFFNGENNNNNIWFLLDDCCVFSTYFLYIFLCYLKQPFSSLLFLAISFMFVCLLWLFLGRLFCCCLAAQKFLLLFMSCFSPFFIFIFFFLLLFFLSPKAYSQGKKSIKIYSYRNSIGSRSSSSSSISISNIQHTHRHIPTKKYTQEKSWESERDKFVRKMCCGRRGRGWNGKESRLWKAGLYIMLLYYFYTLKFIIVWVCLLRPQTHIHTHTLIYHTPPTI